MANAIPLGSEPVSTAEFVTEPQAANSTKKQAKAPVKVVDGVPEGAIKLESHDAYRVDN